jgi:hypothetical protein
LIDAISATFAFFNYMRVQVMQYLGATFFL